MNVIFLEPDTAIRRSITETLRKLGHTVHPTATVHQTVKLLSRKKAARNQIDCVILDNREAVTGSILGDLTQALSPLKLPIAVNLVPFSLDLKKLKSKAVRYFGWGHKKHPY